MYLIINSYWYNNGSSLISFDFRLGGLYVHVYNNNINIIDIYNNFSYYIIYYIIIIYVRACVHTCVCTCVILNVTPNCFDLYDYKDTHNRQDYLEYPHNQYYYHSY